MLRTPLAALLVLFLLLPAWASDPVPAPHLSDQTLSNVIYVRAGTSTGSAFLFRYEGRPYIVTARHVVDAHLDDPETPLQLLVGGRRGREIRHVRLLAESRRADVAVFLFEEDPNVPYFPEPTAGLSPTADLRLASPVFLVGYPAALEQTYGSTQLRVVGGWVAGLKKYVPGSTVEYVDLDMPGSEHGHSGGPILLLPDRVVAVAVQRRTGSIHDTIGATYAVPIKYVTSLIDGEPVDEDTEALDETLRGTALVGGLAVQGKNDYDVWVQRVHLASGERVWGDAGIYVTHASARESAYALVPSDDGSTLVVHTATYPDGHDADIFVQKVSRYGELLFDRGDVSRVVAATQTPEHAPAVVSDGQGGAIVAYETHLANGDIDVRAQRITSEGQFLWSEIGNVVSAADAVPERAPKAVSDGAGGAIVVLERHLADGNVDLLAQRIRADGTLAWHEGKRSAVVAASMRVEVAPRVVRDGEGGAIVVYLASADGRDHHVVAQRISRHGELLWSDGKRGVLVSSLPVPAGPHYASVVPDGLGGAFVAFEVRADATTPYHVDVAVQRLTATGTLVWGEASEAGRPRTPVLAGASAWSEQRPVLVLDGQGGVVVGFESGSSEGDLDVLAQRIDGEGQLRWNGGARPSAVAFTFLPEHTPRAIGRFHDRVLFLFEVEKENGRGVVACQALDVLTGKALYGGGKLPMAVVDHDTLDVHCLLEARE